MSAYYNENDAVAVAWLRELIKAKLIADGEVDERSIEDVEPSDVVGFSQCHFFAGIGGWSYALRLAEWPDERQCWTFSCPCQRFSTASRGRQIALDMWPEQRRLLVAGRPCVFFGEQVANARDWFDGVCADVESVDYEVGAAVLPAVAVGADHARARIYFVGHTNRNSKSSSGLNAQVAGLSRDRCDTDDVGDEDGVSAYMAAVSGFGNAIVPQVAQVFIEAYMTMHHEASGETPADPDGPA